MLQFLGLLMAILLEYYNIHPLSDLLDGSSKWDGTSNLIWFCLIICPAVYAVCHRIKGAIWLLLFSLSPLIVMFLMMLITIIFLK